MKKLRPLALAAAIATPFGMPSLTPGAFAQEVEIEAEMEAESGGVEEGFSLMEEGAKLLLRGLMAEMEPKLDDLKQFSEQVEPGLRQMLTEFGPALGELMKKIDDFTAYHPPEMLPNGDIIIRRKTPEEMTVPEPKGEIEL